MLPPPLLPTPAPLPTPHTPTHPACYVPVQTVLTIILTGRATVILCLCLFYVGGACLKAIDVVGLVLRNVFFTEGWEVSCRSLVGKELMNSFMSVRRRAWTKTTTMATMTMTPVMTTTATSTTTAMNTAWSRHGTNINVRQQQGRWQHEQQRLWSTYGKWKS